MKYVVILGKEKPHRIPNLAQIMEIGRRPVTTYFVEQFIYRDLVYYEKISM